MTVRSGLLCAALLLACGLAACTPDRAAPARGTITGHLYLGGGPAPPLDKHGRPIQRPGAGVVTVFTPAGHAVRHVTVRGGKPYTFHLPPGRYLLNSGPDVWDPAMGCRAVRATVRSDQVTRVAVFMGCLYR